MNRPPNQYIAPVQEPYGYIIFRASEVKDLSVDEPPPAQSQHSVHDDPAVLGVRSFSFLFFKNFFEYDEIISDVKTTIIRERKKPCGIFRCLPSDSFFFVNKRDVFSNVELMIFRYTYSGISAILSPAWGCQQCSKPSPAQPASDYLCHPTAASSDCTYHPTITTSNITASSRISNSRYY